MKIEYNGKIYDLDVERSIQLGVLKENYEPKSGDLFTKKNGERILLVINYENVYQLHGLNGGLSCFSNSYRTKEEFLKWKNGRDDVWTFVRNINEDIAALMANC